MKTPHEKALDNSGLPKVHWPSHTKADTESSKKEAHRQNRSLGQQYRKGKPLPSPGDEKPRLH